MNSLQMKWPGFFLLGGLLLCAWMPSSAQKERKIKVYKKYKNLEPLLHKNNDTTYVINFWATWCKPCVAELPYFDALTNDYAGEKLKVVLVSIDFEENLQKRLLPFLDKAAIESEVVLFDDPAQHEWIPKIDEKWSGAIPATYIYHGKKHEFFEKSFTQKELNDVVEKYLNI
ncbi:redoxin domain-containing protein [bacterium]|nr:redoxin domain-containing protein [bacterium]